TQSMEGNSMEGATQDGDPAARRATAARRIVLTTIGSLGDLHPFIAVAKGLQARGHQPVIATSGYHRERVERQGIAFFPVRPDLLGLEDQPELFAKLMDRKTGTEFIFKQIFMPNLRDGFDD